MGEMRRVLSATVGMDGWSPGRLLCCPAWPRLQSGQSVGSFRTLVSPGDLASVDRVQPWSFHLGLAADSPPPACRFLASGFELRLDRQRIVRCVMVQPGVLIGHANFEVVPTLFAPEHEVNRAGACDWIALDPLVVLMSRRADGATRFCLAAQSGPADSVSRLVRDLLELDAESLFREEATARDSFLRRTDNRSLLAPLLPPALEALVGALRSPTAAIPFRWTAGEAEGDGVFSINDLFPLVQAWCEVDPGVAQDLVKAALSCLRADGGIPAVCPADGSAPSPHAAWPLLVQCARAAWIAKRDPQFLAFALPRLHLYLSRSIAYFDPDHDGIPCWQSPQEPFILQTYEAGLASADLITFLLCEIFAFLELAEAAEFAFDSQPFRSQRNRFCATLETLFWDPHNRVFPDRYIGGEAIERITLSAVLPLLWEGLPGRYRENLQQLITRSDHLLWPGGVGAWLRWDTDDAPPPILLPHQFLVLEALRNAGAEEERQQLAMGYAKWLRKRFDGTGVLPRWIGDPPAAEAGADESPQRPVLGAALVLVAAGVGDEQVATSDVSRPLRWLDRHRQAVIGAVVGALAAGVFGIAVAYFFKKSMPITYAEPIAGLARQHYVEGDYDTAVSIYEDLIEGTSGALAIEFQFANACLNKGEYAEAEKRYLHLLKQSPREPAVMMNLGLVLFKEGRLQEAGRCYITVIREFGSVRPDLAQRANVALQIISERLQHSAAVAP